MQWLLSPRARLKSAKATARVTCALGVGSMRWSAVRRLATGGGGGDHGWVMDMSCTSAARS